ncbi:MAG: transcription/translation regulatory transformer protein RfaH [SAR86 cluster bacterium]|uniref:Transcription/translation regulatory transformer protein RfaH n=1 Tax=SAR86 cluster bacterium TaxID=2030880 RepID=A0A2A5AGA8_9GAMM|nr:MAG: transcription/translation regulatory transformer protein RfaH [SAR86 cluster bacterium]
MVFSQANPQYITESTQAHVSPNRQWYVLYAKARQESLAQENLERQGFKVYLPKIAITRRRKGVLSSIIEPFFPRYLFVEFDRSCDNWAPIRSTRGVCGLVRFEGVPKAVPSALIDSLRSNEDSQKLQSVRNHSWDKGERVEIEQGPFTGYHCIFQAEKGKSRVSVLLNLIGNQTQTILNKQDLRIPQYA